MKKGFKLFLLFCFSAVIMPGCGKNNPSAASLTRVVTQVDISCKQPHTFIERHYTDPGKMEYVLLYLRLLKPFGTAVADPEQIHHDVYRITVKLSDGTKRIYQQKAHRYFSKDARQWQMIDPAKAAGLYRLMEKIPSDPVWGKAIHFFC